MKGKLREWEDRLDSDDEFVRTEGIGGSAFSYVKIRRGNNFERI